MKIQTKSKPDKMAVNLNPSSWMHDNLALLGNKKLKDICITGSHDSGMSVLNAHSIGAKDCNTVTQSYSIQKQLELGARYFDIRPVIKNGEYSTGHYSQFIALFGGTGQSISSIISEINKFTSKEKELVVLNLSHTWNTDVWGMARNFNQSEWMSLFAQLKGLNHLYMVQNKPDVDFTDFTLNEFITEKAAVVIIVEPEIPLDLENYKGQGFYLYKSFNVYNSYADSHVLATMAMDQFNKMESQAGRSYFLLSWTLTQAWSQALSCSTSIKALADEANAALLNMVYPKVSSSIFPNIIYQDNIMNSQAADLAMRINREILIH